MNKTRDQIKRKFKVLEKKNSKVGEFIFERTTSASNNGSMMEIDENDFLDE
jgi:hypothetical protein